MINASRIFSLKIANYAFWNAINFVFLCLFLDILMSLISSSRFESLFHIFDNVSLTLWLMVANYSKMSILYDIFGSQFLGFVISRVILEGTFGQCSFMYKLIFIGATPVCVSGRGLC